MDNRKDIWIFAEQQNGKLLNVAFDLLGEAHRLSDGTEEGFNICAVLFGHNVDGLADELIHYGADKVYIKDRDFLEHYNGEGYAKVFSDAINEYKPEIVLFGATFIGNELASRIAAKVKTGLVSNCTQLDLSNDSYLGYLEKSAAVDVNDVEAGRAEGLLKQTRPGDDDLMATIITPEAKPQMATVNPGVMDKLEKDESRDGNKVEIASEISDADMPVKLKSIEEIEKTEIPLGEADIICAGGRGMGDPSGLKLMGEFADKVGGAVGATRFVVDSGWTDLSHQVGQTGTIVRPKIYFACGISGALQHMVGMQDSDIIVAINKNPDAPMMEIADYAICDDLYKIIPKIIEVWDDYK